MGIGTASTRRVEKRTGRIKTEEPHPDSASGDPMTTSDDPTTCKIKKEAEDEDKQ